MPKLYKEIYKPIYKEIYSNPAEVDPAAAAIAAAQKAVDDEASSNSIQVAYKSGVNSGTSDLDSNALNYDITGVSNGLSATFKNAAISADVGNPGMIVTITIKNDPVVNGVTPKDITKTIGMPPAPASNPPAPDGGTGTGTVRGVGELGKPVELIDDTPEGEEE